MSDLVTWLRAQIDHDERLAWTATEPFLLGDRTGMNGLHPQIRQYVRSWVPARIHAEVSAKRAVIDAAFEYEARIESEWGPADDGEIPILRILAQPYADRPGYREEWRP